MVENTAGSDGVAVEAVDGANPVLEDVEVRGLIIGIPAENIKRLSSAKTKKSTKASFLGLPPAPLGEDLYWGPERQPSQPSPDTASTTSPSAKRSSWLPWAIVAALTIAFLGAMLFLHNKGFEIGETKETKKPIWRWEDPPPSLEEKKRLPSERQEIEKLRQEKEQAVAKLREIERQRLEAEQREKERLEREKLEKEKALAKLREMEREKSETEKREQERVKRERQERDQALARQRERERLEREQRDRERQDRERRAKEQENIVARIRQLSVDYYHAMIHGDKQKLLSLYDFPLPQYFSKSNVSRSFVEGDMDDYFSRWSRRSGNLQSVTVVNGSPSSGAFLVRVVYDYTFVAKSGATRRGRSTTDLWWRDSLTGGWRIKSTSETVDRYE